MSLRNLATVAPRKVHTWPQQWASCDIGRKDWGSEPGDMWAFPEERLPVVKAVQVQAGQTEQQLDPGFCRYHCIPPALFGNQTASFGDVRLYRSMGICLV